jgi:hypothetical protein
MISSNVQCFGLAAAWLPWGLSKKQKAKSSVGTRIRPQRVTGANNATWYQETYAMEKSLQF